MLFILFIIVVTIVIVAYFTWWSENTEAEPADPENDQKIENINQTIEPDIYFTETGLDFVVQGYDQEIVTKLENEEITNFDFDSEGNVSIMPVDYEDMIKNSVGIKSETEITIDEQIATKIIGTSAKDGSLITMILVKKDEQLYVFKGEDQFLNSLDQIINFKD